MRQAKARGAALLDRVGAWLQDTCFFGGGVCWYTPFMLFTKQNSSCVRKPTLDAFFMRAIMFMRGRRCLVEDDTTFSL